jgi:hypothetical protein
MKVGGEDESKKYFRNRKMNLREIAMKFGRLAVFIRHGSAEISGLRYGLTLGNRTRNLWQGLADACRKRAPASVSGAERAPPPEGHTQEKFAGVSQA